MPTTTVFYHQSPHHGDRYILSLALNFDVEEDVYQIALTYPYSFSKLQFYLDLVEGNFPSIIHREIIGYSIVITVNRILHYFYREDEMACSLLILAKASCWFINDNQPNIRSCRYGGDESCRKENRFHYLPISSGRVSRLYILSRYTKKKTKGVLYYPYCIINIYLLNL